MANWLTDQQTLLPSQQVQQPILLAQQQLLLLHQRWRSHTWHRIELLGVL